ncbi:MAG: dephospho-CoA kinase [Deltaproteobacteria bacterium]|nr:dephospho-CoA kinase [Deltaproteobacteria bacterium]
MVEPRTNAFEWPLPVFGLTGTIASGKSTLAAALESQGAALIDADRLGHELLWKGRSAYRMVVDLFGRSILGPRGGIDRVKLGARVFDDARARARLEAVLHPAILASARRRIDALARGRFRVVVFEAALLYESGLDAVMDDTIVVLAHRATLLDRLVRLRGMDRAEALGRIRAQWTPERKAERARWVVENNGTPQELQGRAVRLYRELARHPAARMRAAAHARSVRSRSGVE